MPGGGAEPPWVCRGVETNMKVLVAGHDQGGLVTVALLELEAQHAALEGACGRGWRL